MFRVHKEQIPFRIEDYAGRLRLFAEKCNVFIVNEHLLQVKEFFDPQSLEHQPHWLQQCANKIVSCIHVEGVEHDLFMQEFEIRFKIAFFNAENRFTDLQLRTALGEVFPNYVTRYQRPGVVNGFDVNEDNLYCNLLMRDVEESLLINEFDGQEDSDDDYPFQHDSD